MGSALPPVVGGNRANSLKMNLSAGETTGSFCFSGGGLLLSGGFLS